MTRIGLLAVVVCAFCVHFDLISAEKEVLVRDRLVFLLCDQLSSYMSSGKYPPPIKVMPEKYKKMKPGGGEKGRTMAGFKVITMGKNKHNSSSSSKRKSKGRTSVGNRLKRNFPITVLDLQDDEW